MLEYGQFCPVSKATEILGEKWTLLIIRELLLGATRFNQIQRGMSKISPTILNKRLNTLRKQGLIVQKRIPEQRGYEYQLTEAGRELYPIVLKTAEWGMRWARGQMTDKELDVQLLMSDIQRRINPDKLPGGQTVLRFLFTDLQHYNEWWIKIQNKEVDLCTENPGNEVDVYFTCDLRTMTEVWMGDISINQAQSDDRLKIVGSSVYLKNIQSWLGLYLLAEIRPRMVKQLI
ncbi:MAG: helix-turn-helix transcriptional regulator [Nitrospirota bacterium]|nr:MAG: helix-turn-helix transcriptional regulator [Nitrospirota bacterium]